MEIEIMSAVKNDEVLNTCAAMMTAVNPWSKLHFSLEQCAVSLNNDDIDIYLATVDDAIVGFVAVMSHGIGREPMIEYLCVHADYRNQGIGTQLIRFFEDLYAHADNLYLFVSDLNPEAQRLYVRLGYLPVGALPDFNLVAQTEFLHRKSRRPVQAVYAATDA